MTYKYFGREDKKTRFINDLKQNLFKLSTWIVTLLVIILIFSITIFISTNVVRTKNMKISTSNIKDVKIVQLSDFNNKVVKNLDKKVNDLNPDIVVITGDLVDKYKTQEIDENKLLKQFKNIKSPIFFVPGDMEHSYHNYDTFKNKMQKYGIYVLENTSQEIEINKRKITITGIVDPSFYYEDLEQFNDKLKELKVDGLQILLSHRAELMNLYTIHKYELVFTGHTHGGYVKLPFIHALFVSNQGLLPKYVDGKYTKDETTMIVSSGLGVGQFPFRLFNLPKIVNVVIK